MIPHHLPAAMTRRSQLVDDAAKATSTGAVAKSASNDALNAASAKQGAIASISLLGLCWVTYIKWYHIVITDKHFFF